MKLSVIVPAYNVAPYLRKCLDSIISQTCADMEVLIVNDGSTDTTSAIAGEYAGKYPFIRVFNIDYSGPSKARNTALDAASGKWIAFVDGDDYLPPGALQYLLDTAEQYDADIVMGRYLLTNSTENNRHGYETIVTTGHDTACQMLYQKHNTDTVNPSVWGKLFRHELWLTQRLPEGKYYEDLFVMPVIAARCNRIVLTGKPVYYYRINPSGILSTISLRHHDSIEASQHLLQIFNDDRELSRAAGSRLYSAAYNLLLKINAGNDNLPQMKKECMEIIRKYAWKELINRNARLKNRIGAIVCLFPFLLHNHKLCRKFLTR